MTRSRTLEEYRQEILWGLERLNNEDLGLLLTCYFTGIDHVQDAQKNRINILRSPLLVIEIWTRVNQFLGRYNLPPLDGEPPPPDLQNRSTRISTSELPTPSTPMAVPSAASSWSGNEITIPALSAEPAAAETTSTLPVPVMASAVAASGPAPRSPPAPRRFSWPMLGGIVFFSTIFGIHVCPFIKRWVSQARPAAQQSSPPPSSEKQLALVMPKAVQPSLDTFSATPAPPIAQPQPVAALAPPAPLHSHARSHGRGSSTKAGHNISLTEPLACKVERTRVVHGQLRTRQEHIKIALPHGLKRSSPEAQDYFRKECERAGQTFTPRR